MEWKSETTTEPQNTGGGRKAADLESWNLEPYAWVWMMEVEGELLTFPFYAKVQ
jgi:hypothetical protein